MPAGSSGVRLSAVFPIGCATVAFVLTMLCLFAGKNQGFMEDYHIIMLNTSELGENLIPTPSSGGNQPTTTSSGGGIGGFFSGVVSSATAAVGSAVGAIESDLASAENDLANLLAKKLGIHEFYSLHLLDGCDGYFEPNATSPDFSYNVTNCTAPLPKELFNISSLLDHELSIGPIHINLADLQFTQDLQDKLNEIPEVLVLLALPYLLGAGFTGLSILLSFAWLPRYESAERRTTRDSEKLAAAGPPPRRRRRWLAFFVALLNLFVAFCAAVALGVGSGITTVTVATIAAAINQYGNEFGLYASTSAAFKRMTWAAFALMAAAMLYWLFQIVLTCVRRKGGGRRVEGERVDRERVEGEGTRRRWRR